MTKRELIELLKSVPDDMPITRIYDDFPTDLSSVEIIQATRPVLATVETKHWYAEYWLEENSLVNVDGEPYVKIAVLR